MGIYGRNDIEQSSDDNEAGAVVGCGDLNGISAQTHLTANQIEETAAKIAGEAEHIQDGLSTGVELALHRDAEDKHAADCEQEQCAANPFALYEMARPWQEPASQKRPVLEA